MPRAPWKEIYREGPDFSVLADPGCHVALLSECRATLIGDCYRRRLAPDWMAPASSIAAN